MRCDVSQGDGQEKAPVDLVIQNARYLPISDLENSNVRAPTRRPTPILLLRNKSLVDSRNNNMRIARQYLQCVRRILRLAKISLHAHAHLVFPLDSSTSSGMFIHKTICAERQRPIDFMRSRILLHRPRTRLHVMPNQFFCCSILAMPKNREKYR